jgi:hypothetical protein
MGNAAIAQAILNERRYVGVQSGGELTDLGFMVSAVASAFGASQAASRGGA